MYRACDILAADTILYKYPALNVPALLPKPQPFSKVNSAIIVANLGALISAILQTIVLRLGQNFKKRWSAKYHVRAPSRIRRVRSENTRSGEFETEKYV